MIRHRRASLFLFSFFCLSLLLATSLGLAVPHPTPPTSQPVRDPYLAMSFTVYQGTDCDCNPIPGVFINATGRDTDHNDSNITNDRGECNLHLQYGKVYRISIQTNNFESVLFDVQTIDNQAFVFHLKQLKGDLNTLPAHWLPTFLARLLTALQKTE